jgi:hypothetical protein
MLTQDENQRTNTPILKYLWRKFWDGIVDSFLPLWPISAENGMGKWKISVSYAFFPRCRWSQTSFHLI